VIYRLLRVLLRHALTVFFRKIEVDGIEQVPPEGPLLLAANHPNTLIDVLLVATRLKRRVGFVAKAPFFAIPVLGALLRFLGAVPVHRRRDGPLDEAARRRNARVLEDCEEEVARGNAILIFPEGVSQEEPRVQRLKTGLARIALGAEERAPGQVVVVPVALAYDDPETFRSRARIEFAEPIPVAPFRALAERSGEEFAAVRALTDAVQSALAAEVVHVEDARHDPLVSDLDTLYGQTVSDQAGGRLAATVAIAQAVNSFAESEPARVERVRTQLSEYRAALEEAGVEDEVVRGQPTIPRPLQTLAYRLAAPIAWWGILNHLVFYNVPRLVLKLIPTDRLYKSTVKLLTGFLALFACYGVQSYGVFWLAAHHVRFSSPWVPTLIYLGTLPLSGLTALFWGEEFEVRRRASRIARKRRRLTPEALSGLVGRRDALIRELDAARADYLAEAAEPAEAEADEPW
jgi:1-acyl-sn-glycerol-3-phosphate acyltransferase